MKKLNQSGITLVALVITIIILLILSVITINFTIGQRGILTRAREAGRNYTNAAKYEEKQLGDFLNEADRIIGNVTGENTGAGENPEKNKIEFYVNGERYTADEGMTWEEFVESDYNPTIREWGEKVENQSALDKYLQDVGIVLADWNGFIKTPLGDASGVFAVWDFDGDDIVSVVVPLADGVEYMNVCVGDSYVHSGDKIEAGGNYTADAVGWIFEDSKILVSDLGEIIQAKDVVEDCYDFGIVAKDAKKVKNYFASGTLVESSI